MSPIWSLASSQCPQVVELLAALDGELALAGVGRRARPLAGDVPALLEKVVGRG